MHDNGVLPLPAIMPTMDAIDHRRSGRRARCGFSCLLVALLTAGGDASRTTLLGQQQVRRFSGLYQPATDPANRQIPQSEFTLCQALGAAAPFPISGLDCARGACGELGWPDARPIDWQRYAQGESTGRSRTAHVPEYRLRVDDVLDFIFRLTREETPRAYRFKIGDRLRVELLADPELASELEIQADGLITLRLVGQVRAAR